MPGLSNPRYRGIFPVVPTTFGEDGALDLASQRRCVDFMIDSGVDGLCILANFSEQFLVSDEEREILTRAVLEHVAGRVPVIVTTTHASTRVCAERSRRAQDMGAAMVMVMPPYHGATFRFGEAQVRAFYQGVSDRIGIPIMIQDAPAAGTPLSPAFLAGMAREIEQVSYFKMETAGAAGKLRELIALGGEAVEGPWDGEEAITLLADLEAGVTGSMTGGGYADGIRPIIEAHRRGDVEAAYAQYQRWLPLINHENRQAGFLAAKALMKEGGVIACDAPRAPPPLHPETRRQLLAIARRLDPLVLRWGVERKRRAGGAGPIRGRPAGPCRPPLASGREHSVPLPLTRSYPTAGKIPAVPNHPAGRPCSRSFQSRACPSDMHPGSRRSRA